MNVTSFRWLAGTGWSGDLAQAPAEAHLVLYFGAPTLFGAVPGPVQELVRTFPGAVVCGCSTAGEISANSVHDGSLSAVVVRFAKTSVRAARAMISGPADSQAVARQLAAELAAPDLAHILVLSDGLLVNGTSLTAGFRAVVDPRVSVTGGLAGDGANFRQTWVGLGADLAPGCVVAIGFYGTSLTVGCGSAGGWQAFGPRRLVTRSTGNVLYELDRQPALELYKKYLGERAAGLPATGLLFPLALYAGSADAQGLVRTILAVDEAQQSLTFAGDIPTGHHAQLMRCTNDRLIGGALAAAESIVAGFPSARWDFAVLVSCVGRKLVMGQRIEEEVEAVTTLLGDATSLLGFYSYGEICPSRAGQGCDLHNQTMTLTAFAERA